MQSNKLGCFTATGIFATLVTLIAIVGMAFASGSRMFIAGNLNAQAGDALGGVASHAQIAQCSACHSAPWEATTMAGRCMDCHSDVRAQLPGPSQLHGAIAKHDPNRACRACHPEHRGASAVLTDLGTIPFPHETFEFSLTGHQKMASGAAFACKDCHPEGVTKFAPDTCESCHRQVDAGFTVSHALAFGTDCLACHDGVDVFGKGFMHAVFNFKLDGKHAQVECAKCHLEARTVVDLQSAPQDCYSCHQKDDEHEGRFGSDCSACHNPSGWDDALFDHNLADFKLAGKHTDVKCEQCHIAKVFKGTPQDCYSCHQKDDKHDGQYGKDCAACHNPSSWKDAKLDHNLFAFKLDGAHVNVACEKCHVNGVFRCTPQDCYSCHAKDDNHDGKFGKDCSACHTTSSWKDATFDHNLSGFPLSGGHAGLPCERCHSGGQYSGLSASCSTCHGDPPYHAGLFGANCASCHDTNNWSAVYRGPHPGIANEGGRGVNHGSTSCHTCHTSTLHSATCTACHDGNGGGDGGGDD